MCRTQLCIGIGDIAIDRIFDRLVVGLDGDLVLSGTALVVVVLELAAGDVLAAHGCDCGCGVIVSAGMRELMLISMYC